MPQSKPDRTDLLPGTLELLILRTIDAEPMHGYAIAQHIHRLSAGRAGGGGGDALYPALAADPGQRLGEGGVEDVADRTTDPRVYADRGRTPASRCDALEFSRDVPAMSRVLKG